MKFYDYKDYTIYPTPRYSTESGNWKIHLTIRYKTKYKIFTNDISFNTEYEAVFNCIQYGKQLIDEGRVIFDQA